MLPGVGKVYSSAYLLGQQRFGFGRYLSDCIVFFALFQATISAYCLLPAFPLLNGLVKLIPFGVIVYPLLGNAWRVCLEKQSDDPTFNPPSVLLC